ncbi:unnamed protein product [Brassicogethes aeneus]|uniref:Membrane insertase YidC/Oxa/ALB C-terminal domain-containing protein n=1 Tax=Brassicogethes aeneus TaxID=1431903 RepID=A0A9P0AUE8_BRAAE|nr:unnamed protein product [Brassicogethes aeneus]
MFRFSPLPKIKDWNIYRNSLKYLKNNTLKTKNDIVDKIKLKETVENTVNGFRVQNQPLLCLSTLTQDRKLKRKSLKTKQLKKDFQRICENIQNKIKINPILFGAAGLSVVSDESVVEPIPEPPTIPEGTEEIINQLNKLGEPTFESMGLGGWSPVGMAQNCFEYLHVDLGLEWWAAIAVGTLVVRLLLFPLVIIAQRNAARMNNYLPQLQAIQVKMTEARQTGNQLDAARYSQELMIFMKEKQLNPFKNMVVPIAQMPIFVSFFVGLRQMTNIPVQSLETGGLWWFTNLTVPDQYFLMPIITSATLYATIELGTDSAKLSAQNLQVMRYFLKALPVVILPFTVNFPGAILCYWVSSNFVSLVQVGVLKIPAVRDYFKIEALVTHTTENLPMKPKGFTEGIKDSWSNMKISRELEERRRLDEIKFQRAGKGPIVKTYKYDPTKQSSPSNITAMNAKKR